MAVKSYVYSENISLYEMNSCCIVPNVKIDVYWMVDNNEVQEWKTLWKYKREIEIARQRHVSFPALTILTTTPHLSPAIEVKQLPMSS